MSATLGTRRRAASLPLIALLTGGRAAAAPASSPSKGPSMTDTPAPRKSPFGDIAPALGDYTDNVLFGDVWKQPELSSRELQILRQMARGKSNKEIGQVLYISEYTVKNHVRSILKKLNAIGRTEAIAIASGRGLVNME